MAKKLKLLVCTKSHCKKRGAKKMLCALEEHLEAQKLESKVCLKKSDCLGKCGRGPVVRVKPFDVVYGNLILDNVADLISSLKKKKIVKKFLLA